MDAYEIVTALNLLQEAQTDYNYAVSNTPGRYVELSGERLCYAFTRVAQLMREVPDEPSA